MLDWRLINVLYVVLFLFQDHAVNDREASQESKRKKDENGTSTCRLDKCEVRPASTTK